MNDLIDKVKEAYSQDGQSPSEGAWQALEARMRKASRARKALRLAPAIAACAAGVILLAPERATVPAVIAEAPVAIAEAAAAIAETLPGGAAESPEPADALPEPPAGSTFPDMPELTAGPEPPTNTEDTSAAGSIHSDVKAAVADNSPGSKSPDIYEEPTFPAENVSRPRKDRRLSLGLNLSSSASGSNGVTYVKMPQLPFLSLVKSENNSTNLAYYTAGPLSNYSVTPTSVRYVHDLPLGVGLTASLAVSKRLSIESGLDYTYLHSVEDNNGIRSDQSLHFIGIPLRAEYKFIMHGGLSVYAGAGASVEKCVKAAIGGTSFMEHGFQCSAEAFAGAEYRILKNAGLYFQPTVSYWFTETVLVTYRTENPLTFSLNAGLRFHL